VFHIRRYKAIPISNFYKAVGGFHNYTLNDLESGESFPMQKKVTKMVAALLFALLTFVYFGDQPGNGAEALVLKKKINGLELMVPGSGPRIPLKLVPAGAKGGAKFTADFTITRVSVLCPNWANADSDMVFYLYKWDTDYETTIAAKPIWTDSETGKRYKDNGTLEFEISEGVAPAGTYLWLLEGTNSTPGFWAESNAKMGDDPDAQFFYKGEPTKDLIVSSVYGYEMTKSNDSPDVGIWYCPYYFTKPYDLWDEPYGPETKVEYRPLCSNTPGDFRKYDADDPDVIDFHLQQIADAKINFLMFELSPGGLGGYRVDRENGRWVVSVNNAREVCKRIKVWNNNEQNTWKIQYAIVAGCHPDVWNNEPGFPAGRCMEDTARDVFETFLNNPEYGGVENYYHLNGQPLLVFWGWADSVSNHWANYQGDKTYGNRFALRPAQDCGYGQYGWNIYESGPVIHREVVAISPGWGHYTRAVPPYVYRRNGDFYRECWEKVLRHPLPQIVAIVSFNDYWENTGIWTADTENLTDADKWHEKDGRPNPSMYWDMTKDYINKMRSDYTR